MQAKLRVFQGDSTKKNLENTNLSEVSLSLFNLI
jgi:hypothetical protein